VGDYIYHADLEVESSGQQVADPTTIATTLDIPATTEADAGAAGTPASVVPMAVSDTRSVRARKWSRIESITIRNFKAIQEATVPLDGVTILVGPNGCGKSSVLQAIHWAARAASYILPKNSKEMIAFERF